MDIFLFILSFITGGVVFTVIYTISLTNKLNNRVEAMDKTLEESYNLVGFEVDKLELELKDLKSTINSIQVKLAEDGYAKISEINKGLKVVKDQMNSVNKEIGRNKIIYEGEIRRINGDIQNTVKMINTVRDDPNTLSRY